MYVLKFTIGSDHDQTEAMHLYQISFSAKKCQSVLSPWRAVGDPIFPDSRNTGVIYVGFAWEGGRCSVTARLRNGCASQSMFAHLL